MSKKSIKKNYIFNVCYQILLLVTPFITAPYVSRVLGADGIGTVSFVNSVESYFSMFASMGIAAYGQREISYNQDWGEKRSIVFWNTKILGFCTSAIALFLYFVFAVFQDNRSLYLIFSFNIMAIFVDITWFFQGMEEFGKIVLRNTIIKLISVLYIFIMIKSKDDLLLYALGIAFFSFASSISLWGYLPKYLKRVRISQLHPFKDFKVVLSLFIPSIAIQVYTVLDKTMIGIITGSASENGYYEQALKISKMVLAVITALGTVMIPRIGYHFERKETDIIKQLMYRGYRFVWFLGIPLCFGLIAVSSNFVPWFYGNGFDKVVPLLKVLAFLILAIGINNVTGMQYLIPSKRQNLFTLTVIIGAGTNFLINIILIFLFQSIGAAIASVAAETVIAVVQIYFVRKELSPVRILREGRNYFIAGIIMLVLILPEGCLLSPSVIHTGIIVLSGAVVYFAVLLVIRDEFLVSNIKLFYKKITSRKKGENKNE